MIIVRWPWGSKTQNDRFRFKITLRLKKVGYKVSLCENCQQQSCKTFIGLTIRVKIVIGGDPFHLKFSVKVTAWSEISDFLSILARNASAVTRSEISSIYTNRKSNTRFPISLR